MTTPQPTRRLRVLAVTPKAVLGGAEKWLTSVLSATSRLDVGVAVLDEGPLVRVCADQGWDVHSKPVGAGPVDMARAAGWLSGIVRRQRPDVILANSAKAGAAALPTARITGTPMVLVKHGFGFDRSLIPLLARESTAIIAVSQQQALGLPEDKTHVILPPTPPPPPGRPQRIERERLRLVMLTRLIENKGVDRAIEAVAAEPDWELVVAGVDDPSAPGERDRLLRLADGLNLLDRFTLLGAVDDPYSLLATADAAAMLSRPSPGPWPSQEGFGLVVVEAAQMGVPVIADPETVPAVGALRGRGVLAVRGDDVSDIRGALNTLAAPGEVERVGDRGRRAARALPGMNETADNVAEVLARAGNRPGAGASDGPAFTVSAPVLDEADVVDDLVANLLSQLEEGDELTIVDGGSRDGTWARLQELAGVHPELRVLQQSGGVSAQRNRAVTDGRTPWYAFTDAGCRPDPGWLAAFRRAARQDVALLTGFYRVAADDRPWQRAMVFAGYPDIDEARRPDLHARLYTNVLGLKHRADMPNGRSLAFSRAGWEGARGFPEGVAVAEDVLFGSRVIEGGGQVRLQTDACVEWDQRPTLRQTAEMYVRYGRGDARTRRPLLIGRNLLRAGVYVVGPAMLARPGASRSLALLGAAAYVSLPVRRAIRHRAPVPVVGLVPAMMALRDLTKAYGCLLGLRERERPDGSDGSAG